MTAQKSLEFKLKEHSGLPHFTLSPVSYRGSFYEGDIATKLLCNGKEKTQDEWAQYSLEAQQRNDFWVADLPLTYAFFIPLFRNKDNLLYKEQIEQIRIFLEESLKKWPLTLSRVRYIPLEEDCIIHNYGMPNCIVSRHMS